MDSKSTAPRFISQCRRVPCLLNFDRSLVPVTIPPGMERPEPYGWPPKEPCFFRADEDLPTWERYIGWHDWAVLLNTEVGRLRLTCRTASEGRHPVTQVTDGAGALWAAEELLVGLPQFFLTVWELELNGWRRLLPDDPVYRVLVDVRERRPADGYRNAVDAAFVRAILLARLLEEHDGLRDGVAKLRERHARHHAAHPWCFLRFFLERNNAFSILDLLESELQRWKGTSIVTPEQIRCERWHKAASERLQELLRPFDGPVLPGKTLYSLVATVKCNPGFDCSLTFVPPFDVTTVIELIIRTLGDYDHDIIVDELQNEFELFGALQRHVEQEADRQRIAEMEFAALAEMEEYEAARQAPDNRPRMTKDQANAKAMQLAEADPQFVYGGQREWARAIGCAVGLITDLSFWREVAAKTGRDRKGKGKAPRVVSLSDRTLAATPDPKAELDCLIREQQADNEASPLEDRPDERAKVRHRKKL